MADIQRLPAQPLHLLVGEGKNAKYVKACTELFMGNKGLDHLEGFEKLVNLEVLWVNNNNLESINGLNANFRMRTLHAENNRICSLKGSLTHFHFLETLDLSSNQLRNLPKLAANLAKFHFLSFLNLKGNPCCEEPDYRLTLIHAVPSLQILDLHQVSAEERKMAAATIGGKTAQLSVAFGKRAPMYDPAWNVKTSERSGLEQDLGQTVGLVKAKRAVEEGQAEAQMYSGDLYTMAVAVPGQSLPAPTGWSKQDTKPGELEPSNKARSGTSGKQSSYRPLDIFSFSTCEVALPSSSNAADLSSNSLAKSDAFSKSLLMTSSGQKEATVQLVQKSVRL